MKVKVLIPAFLLLAGACTPKEKTIDFPTVEASTTTSIIIEKVEMTDSLTTLHMRGYNLPGYWIKVVSETHLEADGKSYEMVGTEGINVDELLWMPADGDSLFVLRQASFIYSGSSTAYVDSKQPPGTFFITFDEIKTLRIGRQWLEMKHKQRIAICWHPQ